MRIAVAQQGTKAGIIFDQDEPPLIDAMSANSRNGEIGFPLNK